MTDAEKYRWLLKQAPVQVAAIAWAFKEATAFDDPDAAVEAAMKQETKGVAR